MPILCSKHPKGKNYRSVPAEPSLTIDPLTLTEEDVKWLVRLKTDVFPQNPNRWKPGKCASSTPENVTVPGIACKVKTDEGKAVPLCGSQPNDGWIQGHSHQQETSQKNPEFVIS